MAAIDILTYPVLEQLLHSIVLELVDTQEEWRMNKLPLTQVCQKWTQITAQLVFNQVFLDISDNNINDTLGILPPSLHTFNNMDIIVCRGCLSSVYEVKIRLTGFMDIYQFLQVAQEFLDNAPHLPSALSLSVQYIFSDSIKHDIAAFPGPQDNMVYKFLCSFIARLPNIAEIIVDNADELKWLGPMLRSVTKLYSMQIQSLKYTRNCKLADGEYGSKLKYLTVNSRHYVQAGNAHVYSPGLVSLSLSILELDFTWSMFKDQFNVSLINFANLESLELAYSDSNSDIREYEKDGLMLLKLIDRVPQVHFALPKLHTLRLEMCQPDCPVLWCDFSNHVFKYVCIRFSNYALYKISALKFKAIHKIAVFVDWLDEENNENIFYDATNRLLGQTPINVKAELHISMKYFKLNLGKINWFNLSHLRLPECSVRVIFDLIAHLPNLRYINIEQLIATASMLDHIYAIFSQPDRAMVYTELKLLHFEIHDLSEADVAIADESVCLIMAYIPSLKFFNIPYDLHRNAWAFVESSAQQYPHLLNLQLSDSPAFD